MSIYIGSTPVSFCAPNYTAWWTGINPTFIYESNYTCTLNQTSDWPTYFADGSSTTSRTIKYAATEYTTSPNANVIYERYTGTTLEFMNYDYFVVMDAILNVAYTSAEATMGQGHVIRTVRTSIFPFCKNIGISNNVIKYPGVDGYIGTTTNGHLTWTYTLTRNASNTLVFQGGAYGFQFTGVAPAVNTTSAATSTQMDFKTPSLIVRENANYLTATAFGLINGDTSIIKIRQRLYKAKIPNIVHAAYTRIGQMCESGNFPTEAL